MKGKLLISILLIMLSVPFVMGTTIIDALGVRSPMCYVDANNFMSSGGGVIKNLNVTNLTIPNGKGISSTGLIGYYPFNDVNSAVVDYSGTGNNGTIPTTGATLRTGVIGNAIRLNGSQTVKFSTGFSNFGKGPFSVCLWYNTTGGDGTYRHLIDAYTSSNTGSWNIRLSNVNQLNFYIMNGTYSTANALSDDYNDGRYHFACGVRSNSTTIRLYVDGYQRMALTIPPININSTGMKTIIGARSASAPNLYFNGSIDDVRIYNRALDPKEIANIYGSQREINSLTANYLKYATTNITNNGIATKTLTLGGGYNGYGNYSGARPMVSTSTVSVTVCDSGCTYTRINDATKQIPYFLFHNYQITVQAPYSAYEHVYLPPSIVASDMAAADIAAGGVSLHGNCANKNQIEVQSIHVISNTGALHPYIQCMRVTGQDPNANENVAIAIVGSTDVQLQLLNLSGGIATNGILAYSAGVSIAQIDMGTGYNTAFETKHNGQFHFEPCVTCFGSNNLTGNYNVIGRAQRVYANYGGVPFGFVINGMTATVKLADAARAPIFDSTNKIMYGVNTTEDNWKVTGNLYSSDLYKVTNSNLKLAYNFNSQNIKGNITIDSSPMNNHAIMYHSPIPTLSGFNSGGAIRLDGVGDYISTNNLVFDHTKPFTMMYWIKSANYNLSYQNLRSFFGARGSTASTFQGAHFEGISGKIAFIVGNDTTTTSNLVYGNGNVFNNQWHHIVGVYNGTHILIYQDGVLITPLRITFVPTNPNRNFEIGRDSRSTTMFFNGSFDDVRVYNISLTAAQIKSIYLQRAESDDAFVRTGINIVPPSTSTNSIGNITRRWLKGWFGALDLTGNITISDQTSNKSVIIATGDKVCLDGSGCTKFIKYNGSCIVSSNGACI